MPVKLFDTAASNDSFSKNLASVPHVRTLTAELGRGGGQQVFYEGREHHYVMLALGNQC